MCGTVQYSTVVYFYNFCCNLTTAATMSSTVIYQLANSIIKSFSISCILYEVQEIRLAHWHEMNFFFFFPTQNPPKPLQNLDWPVECECGVRTTVLFGRWVQATVFLFSRALSQQGNMRTLALAIVAALMALLVGGSVAASISSKVVTDKNTSSSRLSKHIESSGGHGRQSGSNTLQSQEQSFHAAPDSEVDLCAPYREDNHSITVPPPRQLKNLYWLHIPKTGTSFAGEHRP